MEVKPTGQAPGLDSGTYGIIRGRLEEQRTDLASRLARLNTARHEIFSSGGFELIANQRITTENHGVARGLTALGDLCIFGYNVQFGLREDIRLSDVFSIYRFTSDHFDPQPLTLIEDPQFITDFTNLYKYYRDSLFAKFISSGTYLYMIFQTSKNTDDRKAFKWLVKNNTLQYIDDRSLQEVNRAPQFDFQWTRTSLEDRRLGVHPHISILDKLFIEAIGGDITFKIENNTATGRGIYHEPVMNKDQQLDDAEYYYADLGNLLAIKIRPYQEEARAYIYNVRTREVQPIKTLLDAGILLPDNQGVIFPNGYYLQNGEYRIFETDLAGLEFVRSIPSPNGEDFMYVFYHTGMNTYVLMSYNIISHQVETPITCNGYTVFPDGKLVYFRSENEPVRHHQVQIWETPYTAVLQENTGMQDNVLFKIGNKDIVSAMSESHEILQLLGKEDSFSRLYEDISKKANDLLDSYFWIADEATFNLAAPLKQVRDIAATAIDEFARVQEQRQHARDSMAAMQKKVDQLVVDIKNAVIVSLDELVKLLASVRTMQGAVIDLGNVRYIESAAVTQLGETLDKYNGDLSQDTINFLLKEQSLLPYEQKVSAQKAAVAKVTKVIEAKDIDAGINGIAGELEMLIDILNSLKIEDSTQSTGIIEKISLIFASLNEVKADLIRTTTALREKEAGSEFHAQLTLLEQGVVSFLDLSTSPDKAENYFTKASVQVEELESRFADFPEFVVKIADKRDEIIRAFNVKKEMLVAAINKRTSSIEQIGLRVLKNIENKAASFDSREQIYAFFSADLMIGKVRSLAAELATLGDVAKAENLENLLKLSQEEAIRTLKDKTELFVDGQNIIALGDHKFVVNKQVLDLGIVRRENKLFYHLSGTGFYKEVNAEELYRHKEVWEQEIISENNQVYRGEYLAWDAYQAGLSQPAGWDAAAYINERVERDYAAGYLKGVHNTDGLAIYIQLKSLADELGILRYPPAVRAAAHRFWFALDEPTRQKLQQLTSAAQSIESSFPGSRQYQFVTDEIKRQLNATPLLTTLTAYPGEIAGYLYREFSTAKVFSASQQAIAIRKAFNDFLVRGKKLELFRQDTEHPAFSIAERAMVIENWVHAFTIQSGTSSFYIPEVVSLLLFRDYNFHERTADAHRTVTGLKGTHPVIYEQQYQLDFHAFTEKMAVYHDTVVPAFTAFNQLKSKLSAAYRTQLKISEFEPKVLSSFVRNRLINEVYFPLIGTNLAKQIGSAGDDKRTSRMGMLLLISPPGYGKTTLMEYLAKTMGLHFVKINGPTIGHSITSIDPVEASTSGAREELKKINLALEMADNVMLYLDDIQHCGAEFLQKFIALADGQRKMDGIFEGVSRTYDLRGKRFCIVMAGNPYTESGEQFKIPDMLANRADVYNLGDVIGSTEQLFNLSLVENAVAENRYLQRITNRSFDDLYKLVSYIETSSEMLPALEGNYAGQEVEDAIAVLRHIMAIRNLVVRVNQQYIASAAMKDRYRTEPAFKLQGSYRNMNKMVGKLVPLMNSAEVDTLMLSHYEGESQTLTSDAEANLLKLKELMGNQDAKEKERWEQIRTIFRKNNRFGGLDGADTSGQMLVQLSSFNEHLEAIAAAINQAKGSK
ncbi:MAG: AAA family ATPase [Chitinophagaceae bacterium]|nr:MAG: AAA family ATPase [Chitinophagaceae bacterium]